MNFQKDFLIEIDTQIDVILLKIFEYETRYKTQIEKVHPIYRESARNLVHYLALRTFDNNVIQEKLTLAGFPISSSYEGQIKHGLLSFKTIINGLLGKEQSTFRDAFIDPKQAKQFLKANTKALFGKSPKKRETRIMVTQPTLAAEDPDFSKNLIEIGMNSARVNCSHDNEIIWKAIIDKIKSSNKDCKIFMDLGGPKLRTSKMKPGPKVIHIKPKRNALGQVTTPAKVWLAPYGMFPKNLEEADAIIPVNKKWLNKTKQNSYVVFRDARNKKCKFVIDQKEGVGRWASCSDSAFVTTETLLNVFFEKKSTSEIHSVHELLPLEEIIYLFEGDLLRLDMQPILGEPAQLDENGNVKTIAHISCSLPEVIKNLKVGEPVFFDDGKIEGVIDDVFENYIHIKITSTKKKGGKLRAEKGINFPESKLDIRGLTDKDKSDLEFIAEHADAVNFSFVNTQKDVADLLDEFKKLNATLGIVIKVETLQSYKNLPNILLNAMQNYPVGVMIARGDLAIEVGWKKFAIIQEEILRLCEAAHLPTILATQVLENLAKKGVPTRSEITDAAMAQRAECVMLNKGIYISKATKMLDKILREMQNIQRKKKNLLPKLRFNPIE
ncbi:MAG: hypothetical protein KJN82_07590 [Bacteroidia bacterium]|nr:hypothetical protein [Bacteroidia bacterium]